jgi:hypothetical protein
MSSDILETEIRCKRKEVIRMKRIASLLMGMGFVLALGSAYAADIMEPEYPSDKMITNNDLSNQKMDEHRATVNQMPSENSVEGSGAGGVSGESDNWSTKSDLKTAPAAADEKKPASSGSEGTGAGGSGDRPDRPDIGY